MYVLYFYSLLQFVHLTLLPDFFLLFHSNARSKEGDAELKEIFVLVDKIIALYSELKCETVRDVTTKFLETSEKYYGFKQLSQK